MHYGAKIVAELVQENGYEPADQVRDANNNPAGVR